LPLARSPVSLPA